MKKTLSEQMLRRMIRNILKESMFETGEDDIEYDFPSEEDMAYYDPDVVQDEIDDMYDEYGNKSQYMHRAAEEMYCGSPEEDDYDYFNKPGFLSMAAQGGNPQDLEHIDDIDGDDLANAIDAHTAQDPYFWASKKPGDYTTGNYVSESKRLDSAIQKAVRKAFRK